jgi:hypothetical protein
MSLEGCQFGVFVDRYTCWPVVIMGTTWFDVTKFLAKLYKEYRVPVSCTSDEGKTSLPRWRRT